MVTWMKTDWEGYTSGWTGLDGDYGGGEDCERGGCTDWAVRVKIQRKTQGEHCGWTQLEHGLYPMEDGQSSRTVPLQQMDSAWGRRWWWEWCGGGGAKDGGGDGRMRGEEFQEVDNPQVQQQQMKQWGEIYIKNCIVNVHTSFLRYFRPESVPLRWACLSDSKLQKLTVYRNNQVLWLIKPLNQ